MNKIKDFLGNSIKVGQRAIRVHSFGHWKEFVKVTVVKIDETKQNSIGKYMECVGIISDGNTKIGWTYPERLIVETAFKEKI